MEYMKGIPQFKSSRIASVSFVDNTSANVLHSVFFNSFISVKISRHSEQQALMIFVMAIKYWDIAFGSIKLIPKWKKIDLFLDGSGHVKTTKSSSNIILANFKKSKFCIGVNGRNKVLHILLIICEFVDEEFSKYRCMNNVTCFKVKSCTVSLYWLLHKLQLSARFSEYKEAVNDDFMNTA